MGRFLLTLLIWFRSVALEATVQENRFQIAMFKKYSTLKLQGSELSYLIHNIIKRSFTTCKIAQSMPMESKNGHALGLTNLHSFIYKSLQTMH